MRALLDVSATGLTSIRIHPLRSAACLCAMIAVLFPYLVGEAVSAGLEEQPVWPTMCDSGLFVCGEHFGRPAPISIGMADRIRGMDGVTAVTPLIVGDIVIGKDQMPATIIGVAPEFLGGWAEHIDGSLPRPGGIHEIVISSHLAKRLGLKVGAVIPPFYRNDRRGERLSKVVGLFRPNAPLWQARSILTTFDSAEAIFDQEGDATDLLVCCEREKRTDIRNMLMVGGKAPHDFRFRVRQIEEWQPITSLRHGIRGTMTLLFLPAFACSVLVLTVTSGSVLAERRREVAILKASGWQMDEILLRATVESLALGLAAAGLALGSSWVWLRIFNGYGAAAIFFPDADFDLSLRVPFRFAPGTSILGFVLAPVLVLSGTLTASWRAAAAEPSEALR